MAAVAFTLPGSEASKSDKPEWTPIDTTRFPTKELTALWQQHVTAASQLAAIREEMEKQLMPYLPDAPDGMTTQMGWRFGGVAFAHLPERKAGKGKMVLQAKRNK